MLSEISNDILYECVCVCMCINTLFEQMSRDIFGECVI